MEVIGGRHPPRHPPNTTLKVTEYDTFHLRLKCASEGLRALRFLLTSFYSRGKNWEETELVALFEISEYFNSYRNKAFFDKHGVEFLKLRTLARLSVLNRELTSTERAQEKLVLAQQVLFNPRAFRSLKALSPNRLLGRLNRRLKRPHPEPRRVGVGYRDKGAATDTAIDGSPRWTDVAVSPQVRFGLLSKPTEEWWALGTFFGLPSSKL